MNKHTPGPWTHEGQGDITGIEDNGFGRGPVDVCSVYLRTVEGRHEANARLIAAAPDLLEALEAFERISALWLPAEVEEQHAEEMYALHMARNQMLAAIAKARGEA